MHIRTVLYKICRATTNLLEVGTFLKDVCPSNVAWGGGGAGLQREGCPDTFSDTLSFPFFVVNTKWHSSNSAFCPHPLHHHLHSLSVFCLMPLIVMSWMGDGCWMGGKVVECLGVCVVNITNL